VRRIHWTQQQTAAAAVQQALTTSNQRYTATQCMNAASRNTKRSRGDKASSHKTIRRPAATSAAAAAACGQVSECDISRRRRGQQRRPDPLSCSCKGVHLKHD